jgi:hypothetical protein
MKHDPRHRKSNEASILCLSTGRDDFGRGCTALEDSLALQDCRSPSSLQAVRRTASSGNFPKTRDASFAWRTILAPDEVEDREHNYSAFFFVNEPEARN